MMILLAHDLNPLQRFQPESMQLNLEERNSTASLTVGPDAPDIKINDWMKDETEPGAGIIWRVKTVTESVETQTRTISLEHVVQYLKDQVMFADITPKIITGNSKAEKCTAREAAAYVMRYQSLWRLGELEASASNPYSFNGETVYSALETITGSLQDMQWEYDLTSLPFTLHIRRFPEGFQSEMRLRRNITTMKVQVDRTRMYTRMYPIGKNNLHIDGDYVSRNERTWGVVCKVETENSKDDKNDLKNWALERLNRHCEPLVTVTVSGLELSGATGEALDHIMVGRRCRIPLPDYGTTVTEKVTKLSWADKIKEPEKVTVTLANQLEDVASIVNSMNSSGGGSSRAAAKKDEEDHAWFVDTTTHVAMVAEAVAGEGAGEDWSRVASVVVDGEGIHQRVVRTEGEIVTMWSSIEVLDEKITLEVANVRSDTFSKIEQTASSIRMEVNSSKSTIFSTIMQTSTNIYIQVGNAKSDTYAKIETTASSIRTEVNSSKSTIFSTIMQTATNIYTQVGNAKSDTYSKIEQTASSIRTEVNAANSTVYSTIMQTATNIYTQVGNAKSDMYSSIEQTASSIRSEVSNASSGIYSTIEQTANSIRTEVSNSSSTIWSSIVQTSTEISQKVSKDGIISEINQTAEAITIAASRINLTGYVKATDIDADYIKGKISDITVMSVQAIALSGGLSSTSGDIRTGGTVAGGSLYLGAQDMKYAIVSASVSGNTLTLTNANGDTVNFNKAATLTSGWSGGTFTVTANPGGSHTTAIKSLASADITWSGTSGTFYVMAYNNGSEIPTNTGRQMTIDASSVFDSAAPYCSAAADGSEMSATKNMGWNETYEIWAGMIKSNGQPGNWSRKYTIKSKALPTIDNVDRKSTGISGSNAGDVSAKSGNYVTFTMAGSSYYIKIA